MCLDAVPADPNTVGLSISHALLWVLVCLNHTAVECAQVLGTPPEAFEHDDCAQGIPLMEVHVPYAA